MTVKRATKIGEVKGHPTWVLYRMEPPLSGYSGEGPYAYVVSSAAADFGEPETYLFGSDESGAILDWGELPGSMKGTLDHDAPIRNAGYQIATGGEA